MTYRIAVITVLLTLLAVGGWAQTPAPEPATTTSVFPTIPLPTAIAGFGEFNQLGTPRFTMGFSAIYPLVGSAGVYATTTADILPKLAVDPTTKKPFYAVSSSIRQGFHKDLFDTGRFSFLVGGDVGPSFSSAQPSGINIDFSTSFIATGLYQLNPTFSLIVPVRMLHISGIGWNPIFEAGITVNLKSLAKAKQ
jgi:hypothetical protein